MKTILIVAIIVLNYLGLNAQNSTVKIGVNYNSDFVDHKLGKISYPNFEATYERKLGNNFSMLAIYNFAERKYKLLREVPNSYPFLIEYQVTNVYNADQNLIISGRYYINPTTNGIYFEAGIPFTYTTETRKIASRDDLSDFKQYSYSISTIGGVGIKHAIDKNFCVELAVFFSPSFNFLDEDYGTSGFLKSNLNFTYTFNKKVNKTVQN